MIPTLRDRWRWWRWFIDENFFHPPFRPGDPWLGKTREMRDRNIQMIHERQNAREPWPRKRYDWKERRMVWITNLGQDAVIKYRLVRYGPK